MRGRRRTQFTMTMKLRNRLIALICLIIFLGLGAGLFMTTTARKPFAVILFVADNISPSSLSAVRLFSGGGDARLAIEEFPNTALSRNAAADYSVPDSASASTQIASGKRVNKGILSMDGGRKLSSLLEDAAATGRSTGIVTTGSLFAPSVAAFYAKTPDAGNKPDIAAQFRAHTPIDFTLVDNVDLQGGKEGDVAPSGVTFLHGLTEIESRPFWKRVPVLGVIRTGQESTSPSLSDLVRVAISQLQTNRKGYFLVVDDPMIAAAAAKNKGEQMLGRLLALDQAVSTARKYAGQDALIIVTGRENVGGLQLNGYPFLHDKGVAILAMNNQGYPSLSWSTGPGFASEGTNTPGRSGKTNPQLGILAQPAAYPLPDAVGTAGDVLSAGTGPGSSKIHGFLDLTDLHRIIGEAL